MNLEEKYKKESGYDVAKIHDIGVTYFSHDYVEWLEKQIDKYYSVCAICGNDINKQETK